MSKLLCLAALVLIAVGCSAGTVGISDVKAEEKATAERIRQAGGVPPADERNKGE
jgi:hypothetical protein